MWKFTKHKYWTNWFIQSFSSVQFSHSVMFNSLRLYEPQHARPPCPLPTPGVYSSSCPLSQWCHPTTSSSVAPVSCLQSVPASGSFPLSQLFASGGQSIGVSASTSGLPMNTQDWFPRDQTQFSCTAGRFFISWATREAQEYWSG